MASIDSGVDTENESSDSNFTTENSKMSDDSKEAKKLRSWIGIEFHPEVPSPQTTQETISLPFNLNPSLSSSYEYNIPSMKGCFLATSPQAICKEYEEGEDKRASYYYGEYLGQEHQNKLKNGLKKVYRKTTCVEFKYTDKVYQKGRSFVPLHYMRNHGISHLLAEKRLRLAASLNHVEAVKRLLCAGVNPRSSDDKSRTALHIAACKGYADVVELLLQSGADPNQKDAVGNTALHVAAYTNHFKVILQLLRATAANLHKVDESGCKLLRIAQSRMHGFLNESNPIMRENNFSRTEIEESLQILDVIFKYCHEKAEADLIKGFSNRLNIKQSKNQGENTIQDVLSSLSELTLQKKV